MRSTLHRSWSERNNECCRAGAGVIDFHVTATPEVEPIPGQPEPGVGEYSASGFSYVADYGPLEAPGAIKQILSNGGAYDQTTLVIFDPPIPDSPLAHQALATPEPGTVSLTAFGLVLMAFFARRQSSRVPAETT